MKISQLREVFDSAGLLCRDTGNGQAAQSLTEFSRLFVGRETMTVSRFVTLIEKATASENVPGT
jgi:hypothetical protein